MIIFKWQFIQEFSSLLKNKIVNNKNIHLNFLKMLLLFTISIRYRYWKKFPDESILKV